MNLSGQNWAGTDMGQRGLDPLLGTVTPSRPVPSGGAAESTAAYVGAYGSIGSILTISENVGGLAVKVAPLEGDSPPLEGELLHVSGDRFMLRIAALGEDMPLTFVQREGDHFAYLHMGARLHQRRSS